MVTSLRSGALLSASLPGPGPCPKTQCPVHFPGGSCPCALLVGLQGAPDSSSPGSACRREPLSWTLISANGNSVLPVAQAKTWESSLTPPVLTQPTAEPSAKSWSAIAVYPGSAEPVRQSSLPWILALASAWSPGSCPSPLSAIVNTAV